MQVKSKEIRLKILEIATDEFFRKGYHGTTMRKIAEKANTSLGNIYNYFGNKEKLLEEIVSPKLLVVEKMLNEHLSIENYRSFSNDEIRKYINEEENLTLYFNSNIFLDKEMVILFQVDNKEIKVKKDFLIKQLQNHLGEHLEVGEESGYYTNLILNMISEYVKYLLLQEEESSIREEKFNKFLKFLFLGTIGEQFL